MLGQLKTLSIKGLMWSASESFGVAVLSFAVFALMARILEPEHFGIVALAGVFILTFNLIVGHSFADAIVQRTDVEPEHLDTAFWTTLAIALALTGLCHLIAPAAARWFDEPALADVLPWLAWVMPLNSIAVVQTALFRRALGFRTVATRSLAGRTVGAAVGVAMALTGMGVWSLVGQQIAGIAVTGIATAAASRWRPGLKFSIPHLRELWSFGFHVSASQVVTGLGEQAMNLLVGSFYGSVALGYFSIAWRITQLMRALIASAVYHVGFSAFARLQDDRDAAARAFLQATRLSCLFGFPIGVGMALLADPLVHVLFGQKWASSIVLLAILALQMFPAFYAMFFSACYRAMGKASWVLWLSIAYIALGVAMVVAFTELGIEAMAMAWVAKSILLLPVQVALLRRMLGLRVRILIAPIVAPLLAAAIMAAALAGIALALGDRVGDIALLLVTIPAGAAAYLGAVFVISPELIRVAARTARIMLTPQRAASQ